jgi:hypothetical protein
MLSSPTVMMTSNSSSMMGSSRLGSSVAAVPDFAGAFAEGLAGAFAAGLAGAFAAGLAGAFAEGLAGAFAAGLAGAFAAGLAAGFTGALAGSLGSSELRLNKLVKKLASAMQDSSFGQ